MTSIPDDRPWNELTADEQDALIAESTEGRPEHVYVARIPADQWVEQQEPPDTDTTPDTYVEGVDIAEREQPDDPGGER